MENGGTGTLRSPAPAPDPADGLRYELVRGGNKRIALAEAVLQLNKHAATARLQIRQAVPILNGSINRNHYYFIRRDGRVAGFMGWALATRSAANAWAFGNDGSLIGDGTSGEGVIGNFLICDDLDVVRYARSRSRDVFAGKEFLCGRRSYANGQTRPVWLELGARA